MILIDASDSHWLAILDAVGIPGTLILAYLAFRKDIRIHRVLIRIELKKEYREIWRELNTRPEYKDLFQRDRNLLEKPLTKEETHGVRELIFHLRSFFEAKNEGILELPERIADDIREVFSSPATREAWNELKKYQDSDFVGFVEAALEPSPTPSVSRT